MKTVISTEGPYVVFSSMDETEVTVMSLVEFEQGGYQLDGDDDEYVALNGTTVGKTLMPLA